MKNLSEQMDQEEELRWERGWEEHETLQRRRIARLPLSEKLRWLEEAQRMASNMRANRTSRAGHRDFEEEQE